MNGRWKKGGKKNNKRRSKTLKKSNWSPKRKQAYPTVQQDRKCLLWGQGSPLDPIKGMHEINSDIMLLGQQTQVDWWRQTVGVIASCWLSLGDAIFSQSLLPACEKNTGCLASPFSSATLVTQTHFGVVFNTCVRWLKINQLKSWKILHFKSNVSIQTSIIFRQEKKKTVNMILLHFNGASVFTAFTNAICFHLSQVDTYLQSAYLWRETYSECILIKSLNHLYWLISTHRYCGSTPSSSQMSALTSAQEVHFLISVWPISESEIQILSKILSNTHINVDTVPIYLLTLSLSSRYF